MDQQFDIDASAPTFAARPTIRSEGNDRDA